MTQAVESGSLSRAIYYTRSESKKANLLEINIRDNHSGAVSVEVISDPGEEFVILDTVERLGKIFSGAKLTGSPQLEGGHRVFTLLIQKPLPAVTVRLTPLERISNGVCGCTRGVLESIHCSVCADSFNDEGA